MHTMKMSEPVCWLVLCLACLCAGNGAANADPAPTPVIVVTDLYHPPQDPGDNFDLIAAYALPEIDLKAVILDVTDPFREPETRDEDGKILGRHGPREPGIIPVTQLNYIFDRSVPYGLGPFTRMRTPDDTMPELPVFQQSGLVLLRDTLASSAQPVEIVSFGSARPIAVAYNRYPRLFAEQLRRIHLCAGATSPNFIEWNVMLDPHAIVRLLCSNLPIALYPCATDSPFALGRHNTYWRLPNLQFVADMAPSLQRYLAYGFTASTRPDFLRAMDHDFPQEAVASLYSRHHNVWETAVWMEVANRRLVQHANGQYRIVPADSVAADDTVLPGSLRPCEVTVHDDGTFAFTFDKKSGNITLYDRGEPELNQAALQQALPALYRNFRPPPRNQRNTPPE